MKEKQIRIGEKYLGSMNIDSEDFKKKIGKGKVLTHVSLFSGCGGLDCGFAKSGIQTRVMIEWDHSACETLRANFLWEYLQKRTEGHWETPDGKIHHGNMYIGDKTKDGIKLKYVAERPTWKNKEEMKKQINWYHDEEPVIMERDIRSVTSEEILKNARLGIGECGIVSGGFPCQGFSMAGKRIIDDPRNSLYKEFVRIVDDIKPASIMGENVQGIVSMAQGRVIHQICEDFANCGYNVTWDLLDFANYGVPQHRVRLILIGFRVDSLIFNGDRPEFHIAACPGEIQHPKLFYDRLKKWSKLKDKEKSENAKNLLKEIEENERCSFVNHPEVSLIQRNKNEART
jgi:DNA (cytosine-5)-methyltransferase 1